MILFKLINENNNDKEYSIKLNFLNSDEYYDFIDEDRDYEIFMEKMECGKDDCCGVHDFSGSVDDVGGEWIGFTSYEIKDFDKAIEKWSKFWNSKEKLVS